MRIVKVNRMTVIPKLLKAMPYSSKSRSAWAEDDTVPENGNDFWHS